MKIQAATLRRIAAMPEQAMATTLLFLAEQLEQFENGAVQPPSRNALRQKRYRERNKSVTHNVTHNVTSVTNVTESNASRVLDNITSTSKQEESKEEEESKEKGNLTVSQKALASKPLPSEPRGFSEFWEIYPRRAGGNDRVPATKGFGAALKRAGSLETILEGARRYRAFCDSADRTGTEYVLKSRKWLNNQSWNEIYESKANGQAPKSNSVDRAAAELLADIDEHWRRQDEAAASPVHGDDLAQDVPGLR